MNSEFGVYLNELLEAAKDKDHSQAWIAEQAVVPASALSSMRKHGDVKCSPDNLKDVAAALQAAGVEVDKRRLMTLAARRWFKRRSKRNAWAHEYVRTLSVEAAADVLERKAAEQALARNDVWALLLPMMQSAADRDVEPLDAGERNPIEQALLEGLQFNQERRSLFSALGDLWAVTFTIWNRSSATDGELRQDVLREALEEAAGHVDVLTRRLLLRNPAIKDEERGA